MRISKGIVPSLPMEETQGQERLRVLEFYSGVGGMRYALQLSGLPFTVVEAFDINEVANDVYQHNFGHRPSEGNVSRVKAKQLDEYRADMWLMAPPCQPYTRQGLKKDAGDGRASSFLDMLQRIPTLQHPPRYILVENVVGFETSVTHKELLRTLLDAGFSIQEFILSPLQFGIPYSRPRYFCLARSKSHPFPDASLTGTIVRSPAILLRTKPPFTVLPSHTDSPQDIPSRSSNQSPCEGRSSFERHTPPNSLVPDYCESSPPNHSLPEIRTSSPPASLEECEPQIGPPLEWQSLSESEDLPTSLPVRPVSDFLEHLPPPLFEAYKVPEPIVSRWGDAFDIVTPLSTRCCCFTKSYVKYAKGTGSILATTPRGTWQDRHVADEKGIVNGGASFDQASGRLVDLAALNLRFFTPREVANLHSFPPSFAFPPCVTLKQQYALLGNSLNAELVARLLTFLCRESS